MSDLSLAQVYEAAITPQRYIKYEGETIMG